ncbi:hypothetical protein TELCIR_03361 [Teladorsagia circumcincta]|uniref:Eukaryotic translation initiation factor 4E transporter n=1 Tax=Teladorsagia circumcincta TaxID=45464 RepID=A0A2G9UWN2_TELCI|nr:hypothetical protein TELCIR_03361 [Teladorsagia circumcincta]
MDENAGLSPQRRGFSGGCRAPADDKSKEGVPSSSGFANDGGWTGVERDRDRLGTNSTKNWRGGSNGGADKYSNKSSDFKLPFQRSTGANTRSTGGAGSWRSEMKERGPSMSGGKYSQSKNQREERMPEWADGSTTMDDMIELRGFEEPVKTNPEKMQSFNGIALSKSFKGNPSMPPTVAGPGGVRAMRLEDLEKAISSKDTRPVPEENAPLPNSGPSPPAPNLAPSVGGVFPPGATPFLPPVLPPGAPIVPPALLARMAAENPALVQAHIQAQLHQAMAAQLAANGGVGVPPAHMHDQIRATLLRLQQQQLVAAAAAQGKLGKVNVLEAAARNNADMLKKMQMQHQYAAMMNAMQGGLPMAAWRPPPPNSNSAVPPNPQAQAQILMQMAQVQQLAHAQQMRLKQQALAKIMQLQGHQQAVAAATGMQVPNVAERNPQNYTGSSSFGAASDLSGPIQSPLEKLLAAAGVQPSQFTGGTQESSSFQSSSQNVGGPVGARMPPPSVRPMSLEELERKLTEQTK